MKARTVFRKPV